MADRSYIEKLLEPYEPQVPLDELVVHLNEFFHAAEASDYDKIHPEVHDQLPPLWRQMIQDATGNSTSRDWRILDFGCGTGFEAEQLLENLPSGTVAEMVCHDLSREMLEYCRRRIGARFPAARFCPEPEALGESGGPFNLLATNSLLHHLPDPIGTIKGLTPLLTGDSLWLMGHEPSNRYYRNPECMETYGAFLRQRRWLKYLSPKAYLQSARVGWKLGSNPRSIAAQRSFEKGLFKRKPSPFVIGRLVDFHVVHCADEASEGRGLDYEAMAQDLSDTWELLAVRSYSFMGPFYEGHLSPGMRKACRRLAERFPLDGANFCAVWKRRA